MQIRGYSRIVPKTKYFPDILGVFSFCTDMKDIYESIRERLQIDETPLIVAEVEYDLDKIKALIKDYPKKRFEAMIIVGVDTNIHKFKGYYNCPQCGSKANVALSKTAFISELTHLHGFTICRACIEERKKEEKIKMQKVIEERKQQEVERMLERLDLTDKFISTFCSPDCQWTDGVKNKYYTLIGAYNSIVKEEVIEYLKSMDYYDFLKTPYWKAIAYEVKKKANFKCVICNSNENLATHHRTYDIRGKEIDNLKDLTCLCNNCHEKHHDI